MGKYSLPAWKPQSVKRRAQCQVWDTSSPAAGQRCSRKPQNNTGHHHALELDGKTLFLKTPCTLVTGHRELKLYCSGSSFLPNNFHSTTSFYADAWENNSVTLLHTPREELWTADIFWEKESQFCLRACGP